MTQSRSLEDLAKPKSDKRPAPENPQYTRSRSCRAPAVAASLAALGTALLSWAPITHAAGVVAWGDNSSAQNGVTAIGGGWYHSIAMGDSIGLWSGAVDVGGGWRWSSWFGFFVDAGNGWVYHNEHGWMYAFGTSNSSIWFWTSDMGWIWTSASCYPYLWSIAENGWVYYQKDSSGPRWFYSYSMDRWVTDRRVVLLLHGMNSTPATWNDFMATRAGVVAPVIKGGVVQGSDVASRDSRGVYYYRVDFGAYDGTSGRSGVAGENLTAANDPHPDSSSDHDCAGDYSSFSTGTTNGLGREVKEAVQCVLALHPDAGILLVAHSRGGLAARAFLQDASSDNQTCRSRVLGLLSLGTPHQGSALGRIFNYLEAFPRSNRAANGSGNDWALADELRGVGIWSYNIDVRRPTIGDLSAITTLNAQISSLPAGIRYGASLFGGADIGCLSHYINFGSWDFFATVWDPAIASSTDPLTDGTLQSRNYVLGTGNTETNAAYLGDGIVPLGSQRMDLISGFPSAGNYQSVSYSNGRNDLHIEEPSRSAAISAGLNLVVPWWK